MNALITLFILSLLSFGQVTSFQRILAKPSSECDDNKCNRGETCESCPGDCGECEGGGSFCGDGTCDESEDCSCVDCACQGGETCDATGVCISCGDGTCNGNEDCNSCPSDCGSCTSPNCPPEATSCVCTDGTTSCSSDNDCPGTTTEVSGTCAKGSRGGLSCISSSDCPQGKGFADCVGGGTTEEPPAEGSCRACSGVFVSSGLIAGDIDQCSEGFLCGDFSQNTNPVDCEPCLPAMTCDTWCKDVVSLGDWIGQPLESYTANSSCDGNGYDACTCTMSSWYANSWTVSSNTHSGAICDAHQFDRYDDCSTEGWCLQDYPGDTYCNSLKVTAITGVLDADGVCTCSATVTSDDQLYIETKAVWSSECIENLYLYDLDGFDPQSVLLPCSFTG